MAAHRTSPPGALASATSGGVPAAEAPLRRALESAYRDAAAQQVDRAGRVRLVDLANQVRVRTLV